jgi:hypothetical protein
MHIEKIIKLQELLDELEKDHNSNNQSKQVSSIFGEMREIVICHQKSQVEGFMSHEH